MRSIGLLAIAISAARNGTTANATIVNSGSIRIITTNISASITMEESSGNSPFIAMVWTEKVS